MNKISKENSEHYKWGDNCDGWRLVNKPEMSVILEQMPAGTSEKKHYHKKARQFFLILKGNASIEIEDKLYDMKEQEGMEIPPNIKHRFFNSSYRSVEFLVTSVPSTLQDRFDAG